MERANSENTSRKEELEEADFQTNLREGMPRSRLTWEDGPLPAPIRAGATPALPGQARALPGQIRAGETPALPGHALPGQARAPTRSQDRLPGVAGRAWCVAIAVLGRAR